MASDQLPGCRPVSGQHALIEAIYAPIQQVRISLTNFIPTTWNNADYQFVFEDEQLWLMGSSTQVFDVRITDYHWITLRLRPACCTPMGR